MYYSGHGGMDQYTKMVLNDSHGYFQYFKLEQELQILSKSENTFTVAVFDCCREELYTASRPKLPLKPNVIPPKKEETDKTQATVKAEVKTDV